MECEFRSISFSSRWLKTYRLCSPFFRGGLSLPFNKTPGHISIRQYRTRSDPVFAPVGLKFRNFDIENVHPAKVIRPGYGFMAIPYKIYEGPWISSKSLLLFLRSLHFLFWRRVYNKNVSHFWFMCDFF